MLETLKKAAAPFLLRGVSFVLRSEKVTPDIKDIVWKFAQRYSTFFDVSVETSIAYGFKMFVSSNPRVEQELFLFGEWEPLFTRYLMKVPRNDGIFLDIGANIGYFSLIASKSFAEVHAIEASPSTSQRLRKIVERNGVTNIIVHPIAVGIQEGFVDFFQDKEQSGGASTIRSPNHIFEARVPTASLERILSGIDWSRVRFAKIDVEGLEASVLDSLFRLRSRLHPLVEIFVEYDPSRQGTWASIDAFLRNGFSAFLMQGPYDRRDYVETDRRTVLQQIDGQPQVFCDLLIRRMGTQGTEGDHDGND